MRDFSAEYENWSNLPDCRIRLGGVTDSEVIWGKEIGDLVGLNNDPLHTEYRWQDIVDPSNGGWTPKLIYRRWNAKIWFSYESKGNEAERKRKILAAMQDVGHTTFFKRTIGFVLFQDADSAEEKMKKALEVLDFPSTIEEIEK